MTKWIKRIEITSKLILLMLAFSGYVGHVSSKTENKIIVHRYVSDKAWGVNSFILESDKGLVLIDAQLLKSDAKKLAAIILSTGKPLHGVIITHPHPDHYGGIPVLKDILGDFPIYATQLTRKHLKTSHQAFLTNMGAQFGEDTENRLLMPSQLLKSGEALNLAGIELQVDDLGAGEAADNVVVYQPELKALFTGDATMHKVYYFVGEGRSSAIIEQFELLKKRYSDAKMLYSGHGEPARLGIVDELIHQVRTIRQMTEKALAEPTNLTESKDHLNAQAREVVAQTFLKEFPNLGDFGFGPLKMTQWNIYGIETELLAQRQGVKSALK